MILNLLLSAQVPSTDRNALSSLWGKLASEILMQNWEAAMEDLTRLRETIDNNVSVQYFKKQNVKLLHSCKER